MSRLSVQKGKRGEREVANILNPILAEVCQAFGVDAWKLSRNLTQWQKSNQCDLEGLDWIAIEVKYHQTIVGKVEGWWRQAVSQAGTDREPALFYRANGGRWKVRVWARLNIEDGRKLRVPADISVQDFMLWFRKVVEVKAREQRENVVDAGLFD